MLNPTNNSHFIFYDDYSECFISYDLKKKAISRSDTFNKRYYPLDTFNERFFTIKSEAFWFYNSSNPLGQKLIVSKKIASQLSDLTFIGMNNGKHYYFMDPYGRQELIILDIEHLEVPLCHYKLKDGERFNLILFDNNPNTIFVTNYDALYKLNQVTGNKTPIFQWSQYMTKDDIIQMTMLTEGKPQDFGPSLLCTQEQVPKK